MKQNKPIIGKLAKSMRLKRLPPGRSRRRADHLASKILRTCAFIADAQMLAVLEHWRFHKNHTRRNVFPPGAESVSSDTVRARIFAHARVPLASKRDMLARMHRVIAMRDE